MDHRIGNNVCKGHRISCITEVLRDMSGCDGPDRRGGGDLLPGNAPWLLLLTVIQK